MLGIWVLIPAALSLIVVIIGRVATGGKDSSVFFVSMMLRTVVSSGRFVSFVIVMTI